MAQHHTLLSPRKGHMYCTLDKMFHEYCIIQITSKNNVNLLYELTKKIEMNRFLAYLIFQRKHFKVCMMLCPSEDVRECIATRVVRKKCYAHFS